MASTTSRHPSHYEVLGVSFTATDEEIKQSYRSLVVRCHPDKAATVTNDDLSRPNDMDRIEHLSLNDIDDDEDECEDVNKTQDVKCIQNSESSKPIINESHASKDVAVQQSDADTLFHQIQTAYNVLRDPVKRHEYDASIQRSKEKESWASDGALEVNLSEMEREVCAILYDENEEEVEQTVYFHDCRCGHTFEIVQDELIERLELSRLWQCEGCSLSIHVNVDMDLS